ncbi:GLOBIN domain-containing protein [Meloidogyne graminicola]|uniref:GLOBIN domain-containing protein n=1 Tax=Meloidogyne graminicola TaxID=189291 RepID=A0A8S9ZUF0_9BILA|nr:GLOBIN domain-containing protein [Meloidogyne graminicola]
MGNITPGGLEESQNYRFPRRQESFGSKSPSINCRINLQNGKTPNNLLQHRLSQQSQRSHSLEHSGAHSPSSSRSSSSNTNTSFINSILINGGGGGGGGQGTSSLINNKNDNCLRQSTEPMFEINGDLNPTQIGLIKRAWKNLLKNVDNDETEIAIRLLLKIFQIDPRNLAYFSLNKFSPFDEYLIRENNIFINHVKSFELTLINVMTHPGNATKLSKHLQQLGGRHVNYTGVTYKCSYWKCFIQALIDVLTKDNTSEDLIEAILILGEFCVEQMKIEYKLQCEAEKLTKVQKRRKRDLTNNIRNMHI